MKKYLLFAEQLYSYPILRPIQQAILQRGDQVAWYLHKIPNLLSQDDATVLTNVEEVQKFKPDAVFVPTNWVPDFFPGVKVEVFHGFNVGKRANSKQDHFRIRGHFDLYCTQGPDTTIPFQELAKHHGYFSVSETGWSKLDPMFKCDDPQLLRRKINTSKPIIFYASTFSPKLTSAPYLAPYIQKLSETGRWHWVVTVHPKSLKETIDTYRNMQGENLTFIEPGEEVIPMLNAADAMLCDTSSIFIEFLLLNKPVVTYKTSVPGPHLLNINNPDDIENSLERALSRPTDLMGNIETYCNSIHPCRDGNSSERIIQATENFLEHEYKSMKPKPLNLGRKFQMRKKMSYYRIK
ncbi:MAG: CDP-glycerol--glycerophosphate glycerophosphotransferase [endosymbiont of Galathealinum brachiosum]|uniref:CDP-glycerol--glycerophosphate glycerophosphotransferase n=1 Tax=endosymbiont of Galathealinum brachiosum TaxID=2200906 RepID=A0A370D9G1_9GAMM|nr:MAG: CDP-glycerol--glycerophosphate glycerophosphotransferase [endosymbiont of Galathealinum brachiosum]